jgi:hypothetical protein
MVALPIWSPFHSGELQTHVKGVLSRTRRFERLGLSDTGQHPSARVVTRCEDWRQHPDPLEALPPGVALGELSAALVPTLRAREARRVESYLAAEAVNLSTQEELTLAQAKAEALALPPEVTEARSGTAKRLTETKTGMARAVKLIAVAAGLVSDGKGGWRDPFAETTTEPTPGTAPKPAARCSLNTS